MMSTGWRWMVGAAAVAFVAAPAAGQSVEAGVRAWQEGRHAEAVRAWQPLAERGDADALFNLGHAYRLGRGVPRDMARAEQHYARAARAGHVEAEAMYGLILFQNGRREEAMPYVRRAAENGDPRAQYFYGTALFNGEEVARNLPLAYAFMSRAAAQGLSYARSQLGEMEPHLSDADRARGLELARAMERTAPPPAAAAPPAPPPPRVRPTPLPPSSPAPAEARPERPRAPAALAAAGGRWRVQLGAFSSEANARRAWSQVGGRLPGLEPHYVRAGAVVRLQAGPLADRAAAARACAAARVPCFPVAP